ncbi:MAG: TPM domain-containing protein [Pyrinomonadaceae bacterium]
MKRSYLPRIITLAATILFVASAISSQDSTFSQNVSPLPTPTGFVNDYAGVLSEATRRDLETSLKNLKETTNPQVEIAVAIVKTTGERPIYDYSLAVARGWGIGSKADDNPSALLFIAIDDRKYFTHVSKDLEDELPDGIVGSLQRQYLVPEFKKGNYDKGVSDTVLAYIAVIRGKGNTSGNTNTAKPTATKDEPVGGTIFSIFCCLVIIIVILIIIFSRSGKGPTKGDRNRWGGGGFGSTGADSSSALPWIIGGILGSGGSSSSSSSSDWGGSSGGWGGFGGGGDFGGGGGGGDW